jgi:hypothetical protein
MKGFISILEAFLAIALIYIVLTEVQINLPARYSDSTNIDRLHRYAHDISFSICENAKTKRSLLNDTMSYDLDSVVSPDVCYKVSVYKNSSNDHLLNSLVYNYTRSYNTSQGVSVTNQTASSTWLETNISNIQEVSATSVTSIKIGDANNDGTNEVVVGIHPENINNAHNTLRMYQNRSGGWIETNISDIRAYVDSIAIGDSNNNGINDVVTAGTYLGLRMYENISGKWVETNISVIGTSSTNYVAVGDSDNDGYNEVITAWSNYTLAAYKNLSGAWDATTLKELLVGVNSISIGDANNDGKNEAVIGLGTTNNGTRVYENKSGGWVETNISSARYGVNSVAIGDANNDGQNDVVIGTLSGTNEVRMYQNKSGKWVETNISDEPDTVYSVAIGDANNDGSKDVVIGMSATTNEVRMYENKTGTWVETNISDILNETMSIDVGDANNDGRNEFVTGIGNHPPVKFSTYQVRMYAYSPVCSQGTLNSSTPLIETNISDTPDTVWSVAIGDANNDGKNDVVIGGDFVNKTRMYENKSGKWVETNISNEADYVSSVAIGDANNDGKNDVVIGMSATTNEVRMYENKSGKWVETNISDEPDTVYSVAIGDANNDGSKDVVIGMYSTGVTNEVRMYENKTGTWVETNISDVPNHAQSVVIGDANNDGSKDVVIGMYSGTNSTRMYENKSGGWVETNISNEADYVSSVAIGDANRDGQNEVVIGTDSPGNKLRMYQNTSGKWVETNISSVNSIKSVTIGDANNDGNKDVVIGTTPTTNEVRMYENKSGKWVETNISDEPDTVYSVAIGDANNDGSNEVVIGTTPTTNEVRMYSYTTSTWCSVTTNVSYAQCNITSSPPSATFSCLIAGGPNATNYSVSACNLGGSSCLTAIAASDDSRANLLNGQNFTITFSPAKNGSIVEFYLEGYHNQSAALTYLYDSAGSQIASYNFSNSGDEGHVFDLSDFYPDPNGLYNITVKTNYNASYDYAYLNVSSNVYSPKRIVVQTWNNGD